MPLLRQSSFFLIDRSRKKKRLQGDGIPAGEASRQAGVSTGLRLSLAPKEDGVGWLATAVGSHQSLWYLERQQAEAW